MFVIFGVWNFWGIWHSMAFWVDMVLAMTGRPKPNHRGYPDELASRGIWPRYGRQKDESPTTNYVYTSLGTDWNGNYGHLKWRGKYEAGRTIDDMDGMILVEDKEDECMAAISSSRRTNMLLYTKT